MKGASHKGPNNVCFHLHEVSRTGNCREIGSGLVVACGQRIGGEGEWIVTKGLIRHGFFFQGDHNVLKLDCGGVPVVAQLFPSLLSG